MPRDLIEICLERGVPLLVGDFSFFEVSSTMTVPLYFFAFEEICKFDVQQKNKI